MKTRKKMPTSKQFSINEKLFVVEEIDNANNHISHSTPVNHDRVKSMVNNYIQFTGCSYNILEFDPSIHKIKEIDNYVTFYKQNGYEIKYYPNSEGTLSFGTHHRKRNYLNLPFGRHQVEFVGIPHPNRLKHFFDAIQIDMESRKANLLRMKQYPQLHTFEFKNLKVEVVETYSNDIDKRCVYYLNGLSLKSIYIPFNFCHNVDDICNILHYNRGQYNSYQNNIGYYKKTTHVKLDYDFIPFPVLLGRYINFKNETYFVYDIYDGSLETDKGKVDVLPNDFKEIKILNEGKENQWYLTALMNKSRYV